MSEDLSDSLLEERRRVISDFKYWLREYAHIEDKVAHRAVPFEPYPCQDELVDKILSHKWLRILKARQLGITWLYALYAYWRCGYHAHWGVGYIVHKSKFATNFIDRLKLVHTHLPDHVRAPVSAVTKGEMRFEGGGQSSWIKALAATEGAADSITGDLVIIDEATKIERLRPGLLSSILRSVEPVVERAKGSVVMIGTSEGATGHFFDGWKHSERGKGKFENVFFSWTACPDRTREWYEAEKRDHIADPLHMVRQYPATPEEAFSHAEGRIYPSFGVATHVCRVWGVGEEDRQWGSLPPGEESIPAPLVPESWQKWRAIDFGGVDPFVCLWLTKVPGDPIGLTVDPSCTNLIREMQAYRRKPESDYIMDKDNHGPDALRYAVVTFNLTGHIHVYRELYIPRSAAKGFDLPDLAMQIKDLSGGEDYRSTVADRSRTDSILLLNKRGIRCLPHIRPSMGNDTKTHEIEQGLLRVNVFVVGNNELFPVRQMPEDLQAIQRHRSGSYAEQGVPTTLGEHRRYKSAVQRYRDRVESLNVGGKSRYFGGRSRQMKRRPRPARRFW